MHQTKHAEVLSCCLSPVRVPTKIFSHRDEVLQRFGHLEPLDVQVPSVEPMLYPWFLVNSAIASSLASSPRQLPTGICLALCNFVRVVGKPEIYPAAVEIQILTKNSVSHRRAFDMPSRPSPSKGRFPPVVINGKGRWNQESFEIHSVN